MTNEISHPTITIKARDALSLQADLHKAEQTARVHAAALGLGVMVTQHDYSTYSVTISPNVPYGETREQRQWTSQAFH